MGLNHIEDSFKSVMSWVQVEALSLEQIDGAIVGSNPNVGTNWFESMQFFGMKPINLHASLVGIEKIGSKPSTFSIKMYTFAKSCVHTLIT